MLGTEHDSFSLAFDRRLEMPIHCQCPMIKVRASPSFSLSVESSCVYFVYFHIYCCVDWLNRTIAIKPTCTNSPPPLHHHQNERRIACSTFEGLVLDNDDEETADDEEYDDAGRRMER